MTEQPKRTGIIHDLAVVAGGFLLTLGIGPFHTLTVFFTSFEADFGWSRTLISSVHAVHLIVAAFSNVLLGWLTDKYGPKLPLLISGILLGLGIGLISLVQNIWQLYACYVLASLGGGAIFVVPVATVQRRISGKNQGIALGVTYAGLSAARVVFLPLASLLIMELGWRMSYVVFGVILLLMVWLAVMLLSFMPPRGIAESVNIPGHDTETTSDGLDSGDSDGYKTASTETLRGLMAARGFWLASLLFILPITSNQMLVVHIVPFAEGIGIEKQVAAATAGLIGLLGIAGNIICPSLSRVISWKLLVFITAIGTGLSIVWLTATNGLWMFTVFVIVYGFMVYGNGPARLGFLRQLFGQRWLASITGIMVGAGALVSALGPLLAGLVYDRSGSYSIALWANVALWAIVALVTVGLKSSEKRFRN